MDTALLLKQKYDAGEVIGFEQAKAFLDDSVLVAKLLSDINMEAMELISRLTQLAELPFAGELPKVKIWLSKLQEVE